MVGRKELSASCNVNQKGKMIAGSEWKKVTSFSAT
jgi:hypothetical protein